MGEVSLHICIIPLIQTPIDYIFILNANTCILSAEAERVERGSNLPYTYNTRVHIQYTCTHTIHLYTYNTLVQIQYTCTHTIHLCTYNARIAGVERGSDLPSGPSGSLGGLVWRKHGERYEGL